MSAQVKLSGKLPGDPDTNGVDLLRADLVEEPDTLRIALVWIDVQKITIDTDTDEHVPTIRVRRIEPLGDVDAVSPAIRDAVQAAVQARTGRAPIPFGLVEVDEGYDPDQLGLELDDRTDR